MSFAAVMRRWRKIHDLKSFTENSFFSSVAADGSQSPKHFGKKSPAFTRLNEMPVPFPKETPAAAPPPTSTPLRRALHVFGNVVFFGGLGVGSVVGYYTYFYDQDQIRKWITDGRKNDSLWSSAVCELMEYYLDKRTYFEGEIKSFAVPRQDRLLPDLPHPAVKTLVLDLDELLVYSEWTRLSGWKVLKRPAAREFLQELIPYFEIVVYSDQPSSYVDPIMERLDPERQIHRLSRPDTNYINGKHVRDLSKLGRDLSRVLMISAKPDAWALQPENTIKLPPWKKDAGDTLLLDLLPFLQFLATHYLPDVRDVVQAYEGKDIPSTFRERMKQMGEEQQKTNKNRGLLGSFQRH